VAQAPETRYARTDDGLSIAYHLVGESPLDVLVMSGNTLPIDALDEEPGLARVTRRLASFSRLIRWNPRGLGLSDPIATLDAPSVERWVEDGLAVLDAAGSETAALLADHLGAIEALMLAATHPHRVSSVVVINGTARVPRAPDYPIGIPPQLLDEAIGAATEPDAVSRGFDDLALFAPTAAADEAFRSWWTRAGHRGASPAMAQALLRFRFHADVRAVLPLIQAPTLVMHRRDNRMIRSAHGRYLAEHISTARFVELPGEDFLYWVGDNEVMLDEIEEFWTGVRHGAEPDRVLATVLFSDIVGSTQRIVAVGEHRWRDLLDSHDAAVRRQLERFRGREIKTTGDGVVATFDGPARGVLCACAIRDAAAQLGLDVRVGLHTGEVELRGDDISGMTVHIAARIEALARPGEVLVSRTVTDLVTGSGIEFEDRDDRELKGVPGSWRLFAVTS